MLDASDIDVRTLILVCGADPDEAAAFVAEHRASGSDVHFSVAWVIRDQK